MGRDINSCATAAFDDAIGEIQVAVGIKCAITRIAHQDMLHLDGGSLAVAPEIGPIARRGQGGLPVAVAVASIFIILDAGEDDGIGRSPDGAQGGARAELDRALLNFDHITGVEGKSGAVSNSDASCNEVRVATDFAPTAGQDLTRHRNPTQPIPAEIIATVGWHHLGIAIIDQHRHLKPMHAIIGQLRFATSYFNART